MFQIEVRCQNPRCEKHDTVVNIIHGVKHLNEGETMAANWGHASDWADICESCGEVGEPTVVAEELDPQTLSENVLDQLEEQVERYLEENCELEAWDDPGDYPSAAGAGPMGSYSYLVLPEETEIRLPFEGDLRALRDDLAGYEWSSTFYSQGFGVKAKCRVEDVRAVQSGLGSIMQGEVDVLVSIAEQEQMLDG